MAASQEGMLSVNHATVRIREAGQGDTLVYLHGLGPHPTWLPFHQTLAQHYHVVAPDLLGFGESPRPAWLDSVTDYVYHILDLLDALQADRVHLVGACLGGWIAAELATVASSRLNSLTLLDALGIYEPTVPVPDLFLRSFDDQLRLMFDQESLALSWIPEVSDTAAQMHQLAAQVTAARVGWNPYFYNPKLLSRLHRVSVPTLVMWGDNDRFWPDPLGRKLASAIAGATWKTVAECGHLPSIEQPGTSSQLIEDFLRTTTAN